MTGRARIRADRQDVRIRADRQDVRIRAQEVREHGTGDARNASRRLPMMGMGIAVSRRPKCGSAAWMGSCRHRTSVGHGPASGRPGGTLRIGHRGRESGPAFLEAGTERVRVRGLGGSHWGVLPPVLSPGAGAVHSEPSARLSDVPGPSPGPNMLSDQRAPDLGRDPFREALAHRRRTLRPLLLRHAVAQLAWLPGILIARGTRWDRAR